jgi:hypothetical protein
MNVGVIKKTKFILYFAHFSLSLHQSISKNNLYDENFVSEVVCRQLDMRPDIHHIRIVYWDGG